MESAFAWQQLFEQWPRNRSRSGIILTSSQEPISFVDFKTIPGILALERERPDSQEARKVLVAFSAITAVKFTDTAPFSEMTALGFQ